MPKILSKRLADLTIGDLVIIGIAEVAGFALWVNSYKLKNLVKGFKKKEEKL